VRLLRRSLLAIAVLVGLAAVVALVLPDRILVDVAPVERGSFQLTVEEDGKTRVRERYVVSAPLHGMLLRIDLEEGDRIDRGALLAAIVPTAPPLLDVRSREELAQRVAAAEAALKSAEARLARARVALEEGRTELERAERLSTEGVISRREHERTSFLLETRAQEVTAAEFEREVAEHELEMARAARRQLREEVRAPGSGAEPWEIRSPVPGRVLRVLQESEGIIAAGTPLLELADPSELEVVVDLLTSDAVRVAPGARVRIEGWGGDRPLEGRVRFVEPSAFTKLSALGVEEQRVNVVIDIVSPPEAWRSLGDGYRVDARITLLERGEALEVPAAALFRDGERWAVYAVEQGRARRRIVELGPRSDRAAIVTAGVAEGDWLIVYPSDAIDEGVRVKERLPTEADR